MKTNIWILVANASFATLYQTPSIHIGPLTIIKKFSHEASRKKNEELISDRFGNYHEKSSPGSAFEREIPKEMEKEKFAIELAKVIQDGHAKHQYDKLIIAAEPHFYGLLKEHLSDIPSLIHLNKEYIGLSEKELLTELNQHCRLHTL